MSGCSLVAPGLPSLVGGAIPTFAYDHTKHGLLTGDEFGIQMTYMSGTSTCFTGAKPSFTPVLSNPHLFYTRTCQYVTAGSTYTAIQCPKAHLWDWMNAGAYTIDNVFSFPFFGVTPHPFTATFGNSAAPPITTTTPLFVTIPATIIISESNGYAVNPVTIVQATATSTSTSIATVNVPTTIPVVITDCPTLSNPPLPTSVPGTPNPIPTSYSAVPPLVSTSTSRLPNPFGLPLPIPITSIIPTIISTISLILPLPTIISVPTTPLPLPTSVPISIPTIPLSLPSSIVSIVTSLVIVPLPLPTSVPTGLPTGLPTIPLSLPSSIVSIVTSLVTVPLPLPTTVPTSLPTGLPTIPLSLPSSIVSIVTSIVTIPLSIPTGIPTVPISLPSSIPSVIPSELPTSILTIPLPLPTSILTSLPLSIPTGIPTVPVSLPTSVPISIPSGIPTDLPTSILTIPVSILTSILSMPLPTSIPVSIPVSVPSEIPSGYPTSILSIPISILTSILSPPVPLPTSIPVGIPSGIPTELPTELPTSILTSILSMPLPVPTSSPISIPSGIPTSILTSIPLSIPSVIPTLPLPTIISIPTSIVTIVTSVPTGLPTTIPLSIPTGLPTSLPLSIPTGLPTTLSLPIPSSTSSSTGVSSSSSPATSTSAQPSPSPSLITCPAANGTTFNGGSSKTFVIECFVDYDDSDIGIAPNNPRTFDQCISACINTKDCQAVAYLPNGPCYLKSGIGAPNANNYVWGARQVTPASISSTTTSSVAVTTTSMTPQPTGPIMCPGSNGTTYAAGSKIFLVLCDADINGDTFPGPISPTYPGSYENCLLDCKSAPGCVAVSYVKGGPCYLKGSAEGSSPNSNIIGGKLIHGSSSSATPTPASGFSTVTITSCATSGSSTSSSAAPTTTAPICPEGDGALYTTQCGAVYALECGADRFGNDLQNGLVYTDTWERCVQVCDRTAGCVSVSWVHERHGACYMKGSIGEIHRNNNIEGGRKVSECTRVKLHRKRVAPIAPRGLFYGPDYTHIQQTSTVTAYATSRPIFTTTLSTQAATVTKFVVALTVTTVTNSFPSPVFVTTHVTNCPMFRMPNYKQGPTYTM